MKVRDKIVPMVIGDLAQRSHSERQEFWRAAIALMPKIVSYRSLLVCDFDRSNLVVENTKSSRSHSEIAIEIECKA